MVRFALQSKDQSKMQTVCGNKSFSISTRAYYLHIDWILIHDKDIFIQILAKTEGNILVYCVTKLQVLKKEFNIPIR